MRRAVDRADEIGMLVRSLRLEKDMTQAELASAAGIGRQRLSEIESGKVGLRVDTLFALLKALDMAIFVERNDGSDGTGLAPSFDLDAYLKTFVTN